MAMPDSMPHRHRTSRGLLVALAIGTGIVVAVALPRWRQKPRERAVVTGKVTYRGESLRFGTVIFEPEAGQYATGAIQPDGTFQMATRGEGEGVPVGRSRVRLVCFTGQDPSAPKGVVSGEGLALGDSLIPQKYLSSETSGIIVELKPGDKKELVFDLTDD